MLSVTVPDSGAPPRLLIGGFEIARDLVLLLTHTPSDSDRSESRTVGYDTDLMHLRNNGF